MYLDVNKTKEEKGWSSTGIERFNFLFEKVQADRTNNPMFIKTWLKEKRAENNDVPRMNTKKPRRFIQAHHELENSDEEGSIDTSDEKSDAICDNSDIGDDNH